MKHNFTEKIETILSKYFGGNASQIFDNSELIKYLNLKTKSADKGSKSRGSFANLYAVFVLVEDYVYNGFDKGGDYSEYEGAKYSNLLERQRALPFGTKLQNHALNHRMNQEFKKYFPICPFIPIIREVDTKKYWINNNLLNINVNGMLYNISLAIIDVINKYIEVKVSALESFIKTCEQLKTIKNQDSEKIKFFILSLLSLNVDARIFEIVSYSILKFDYFQRVVYWGYGIIPDVESTIKDTIEGRVEEVFRENLVLYKTGRTNANDGGIDFVMKPLGRFFQVTETTDVKKYFLDINKLKKFPVTFVIKSTEKESVLREKIKEGAIAQYGVDAIVKKYMACVEEIINIDKLIESLNKIELQGDLNKVLTEIIVQSKVEFNYEN